MIYYIDESQRSCAKSRVMKVRKIRNNGLRKPSAVGLEGVSRMRSALSK